MSEVYIIHGRASNPSECWFPWLKNELEKEGHNVTVPHLPNSSLPVMGRWVRELEHIIGEPSPDKYVVAHSLGCQGVLRYFAEVESNEQYGGAIFVAPFQNVDVNVVRSAIKDALDKINSSPSDNDKKLITDWTIAYAEKWITSPIPFERAKKTCTNYHCLFSRDDDFVDSVQWGLFTRKLDSENHYFFDKGHMGPISGMTEFPELRQITLDVIMNSN